MEPFVWYLFEGFVGLNSIHALHLHMQCVESDYNNTQALICSDNLPLPLTAPSLVHTYRLASACPLPGTLIPANLSPSSPTPGVENKAPSCTSLHLQPKKPSCSLGQPPLPLAIA